MNTLIEFEKYLLLGNISSLLKLCRRVTFRSEKEFQCSICLATSDDVLLSLSIVKK